MTATLLQRPHPVDAHVRPDGVADFDLTVVVPAYNEESRLPATLRGLAAELQGIEHIRPQLLVVDNGSSDRTAEMVDHAVGVGDLPVAVSVIGCAVGGKGAAVRRGVLASTARFVGFADADLATPADTLHRVVDRLLDGSDVVIASRRCAGAEYVVRQPAGRRLGSWAFRQAIRRLVPGVADTQCGFKFFSAWSARRVFEPMNTSGFSFDVEVLLRARLLGCRIEEVPVSWSDGAGSSLNPLTDGPRIVTELLDLHRIGRQVAS